MRRAGCLTGFTFFFLVLIASSAPASDLDRLLSRVRQHHEQITRINQERENRFLADKKQRQRMLARAQSELAKLEQEAAGLKKQFEENRQQLIELEEKLQSSAGVMGEIVGTVRQVAGDLKATLANSLVSAQFPGRIRQLTPIADSKTLPTVDQLNTLWYLLLQEITESGKISRFESKILDAAGNPERKTIIRIGTFNAITDEGYLRYLPETETLMLLPRQPEGRVLRLAREYVKAQANWAPVAIDPSRGTLLEMLIHAPDWRERIQQGGIIGYIILALGITGLLIVVIRLIHLIRTGRRVEAQLSHLESPQENNPLGRILKTTLETRRTDPENLEALLDEAILREIPSLERGQALVKLITAVAPLLGLLGTVTGMIQTFQAISLFGTGDPKLMASGISQALVTTLLGLSVAIPLLFLHSLLVNRSRTIIQILEEQSAGLISLILEKRPR